MSSYKEAAAYELNSSTADTGATPNDTMGKPKKRATFNPVKAVVGGTQAVVGGIGQGISQVEKGVNLAGNTLTKAGDTLTKVPGVNYGVSFFADYRKFLDRGNVIDLAVAVVIGAAFTAIVTSLVNDIITPILALASGKNLEENFIVLRRGEDSKNTTYSTRAQAQSDHSITWNWGNFIQTVINFFIISACVFLIVKLYQVGRKQVDVTEKHCDYCARKIPVEAVRCPNCTTWLDWDACTRVKNMEKIAAGGGATFNMTGLAAGAVAGPYMGPSTGADAVGHF